MQSPFVDGAAEARLRKELQEQFLSVNKKLDLLLGQVFINAAIGPDLSAVQEAFQQVSCFESGVGVPAVGRVAKLRPQELVRNRKTKPLPKPAASYFNSLDLPTLDESNESPGESDDVVQGASAASLPQLGEAECIRGSKAASVTWDNSVERDKPAQGEHGQRQTKTRDSTATAAKDRIMSNIFGESDTSKQRPVSAISGILTQAEASLEQERFFFYRLWEFLDEPESSRAAAWYNKAMFASIIGSCILNFLQTMKPPLLEGDVPVLFEITFDAIFLTEFALRFLATQYKINFFYSMHNLIDFLGALPPLVLRIISLTTEDKESSEDMRTALLCIVPVLRLLKMLRRWQKFHLLIFSGFNLVMEIMPVLIVMMLLMALTFSSLIYLVEPDRKSVV